MKKVLRPHRCGQCGRNYTKAQWGRSHFWCPECRKYVCQECVSRGSICPACGTKTNRNVQQGTILGACFGGTLMLMSILLLSVGFRHLDAFYVGAVSLVLGLELMIVSLVLFAMGKKQTRIHEEYVSKMPSGTIPLEDRLGYGDLAARARWREANLAGSMRKMHMSVGNYQEHLYYGLQGDWDLPVLTREQRKSIAAGAQVKAVAWGLVFAGIGIFLVAVAVLAVWVMEMFLAGIVFLLVGSLVAVMARYAEGWMNWDAETTVMVSWKTVGFRTAKKAVEGSLREQGLDAKLKKTPMHGWRHPEHTYELPDGNKIKFSYNEDVSGSVYGWVEILFRPSGALAARKLQTELDEYLCERDLVDRAG
jgi:hypothetical protein